MNYKTATISNRQCLLGDPPLKITSFLSLNIGDKVVKIGKGTSKGIETSSNRFDEFKTYAIYSGIFSNEGQKFLTFELPEQSVLGLNTKQKVFLVYSFSADNPEELYQSIPTEIRIYKSVFTLA